MVRTPVGWNMGCVVYFCLSHTFNQNYMLEQHGCGALLHISHQEVVFHCFFSLTGPVAAIVIGTSN